MVVTTRRSAGANGNTANGSSNDGLHHGTGNGVGQLFCQDVTAKLPKMRHYYHNFGPLYTLFHFSLGPLMIMTIAPAAIMVLTVMNLTMPDASLSTIPKFIEMNGGIEKTCALIASKFIPNAFGLSMVLGYIAFQIVLMIVVPGPPCYGMTTATGHVPKYKDNGMACFLISLAATGGITYYMKTYTTMSPTIVVDRFDEILGACNFVAVITCILLYFKGRFFPSTKDNGIQGYPLFDYYWGTELFPRIFGIDIKVLTNCRFGMTLWPIFVMLCWLKNFELFGFRSAIAVSSIAQMLYLVKFFTWEAGYMKTMDIMLDRAGYYICWGCLVFLPGLYIFPSRFFAIRPGVDMPLWLAGALVFTAFMCIVFQQLAEEEKAIARATNGEKGLFGRKPRIIRAKYHLHDGREMESILVTSGFWGFSRHFCYFPELLMTFIWSTAEGWSSALPYFYFAFLVILLANRTYRDDRKCAHKYGEYWEKYMKQVPYRVIPYVF